MEQKRGMTRQAPGIPLEDDRRREQREQPALSMFGCKIK